MSNQFTYEIDERKLRMQLKDLEYPLHENSWQKFESFSATKAAHYTSATTGTFRLNLNRNVVLPVVFGVVVISFSLLLLNFVNLKPAHKTEEQKAETLKPAVSSPAPLKKEPVKAEQVVQTVQAEIKPENTNPTTETVAAEPVHSAGMMGDKIESRPLSQTAETPETTAAANPASTIDSGAQIQTAVNTEVKSDTEVVVKKKRKKHLDPAAQLQEEIRPTVVTDAQEEEVRPN